MMKRNCVALAVVLLLASVATAQQPSVLQLLSKIAAEQKQEECIGKEGEADAVKQGAAVARQMATGAQLEVWLANPPLDIWTEIELAMTAADQSWANAQAIEDIAEEAWEDAGAAFVDANLSWCRLEFANAAAQFDVAYGHYAYAITQYVALVTIWEDVAEDHEFAEWICDGWLQSQF